MKFSSDDHAALPSLSPAEWEVMKTFWDNGPMAARDVYERLPQGHGWAYKTVKTLLSRLVAKGALDFQQIGNSYLYQAVYSKDQLTKKEMKGFVQRVLDGSLSPILAHFIEESSLSEGEIAQLKRLLKEKEQKSGAREGRRNRK